MFKNSENAPDTKNSKCVQQTGPYLRNDDDLEHETCTAKKSKDRSLKWAAHPER